MTTQLVSPDAVAVILLSDEVNDPNSVRALVRSLLLHEGLTPWKDMAIELFPSERGTLLIARRSDLVHEGYRFDEFEALISAVHICPKEYPSQVICYDSAYYLLVSRPIEDTPMDMSEFCLSEQICESMLAHLSEHGRILIPANAITVLQRNFV